MPKLQAAFPLPELTCTDPVFCQECAVWFTPDRTWRCECGEVAAYGVQPGTCDRCGDYALMLRDGHRLRSLCRCAWSVAQLAELAERWRQLDEDDKAPAPRPRPTPVQLEDQPVESWWPEVAQLLPPVAASQNALARVWMHRDEGYSLASVLASLRTVCNRIREKGTKVSSEAYVFKALETQLKSSGERNPKS